jgi:hypothetical protein
MAAGSYMLEKLRQFVSAVPSDVTMKWLLLAAAVLAALVYLYFENRKFMRYHQRLASHASTHDSQLLEYSSNLLSLSSRNRILFGLSIVLLMVGMVFYDIKQMQKQALADREAAQAAVPIAPMILQKPTSAEDAAKLDALKQRYEQAYVNFYVLYRCKLVAVESLAYINSAFMLDMEKADVPAQYAADVRRAAQGTYKELYEEMGCEDPSLNRMAEEHKSYILNIRELLAKHFNGFLTIQP